MGRGQELLDAAREGDRRTVEKILGQITKRSGPFTSLRRGAGVNVQDDNGYTPLHHACLHGRKEIVRLLLTADASPCVVDKKGATPLHLAAFKGDSDVVAMLLAHNNLPNIDQLTSDHETALLIAAHFGYVEVVAQLMAKGADVTIENNNGESALDLAAQYGRLETVQHLLRVRPELVEQYKVPVYKQWIFSSTPLHRASKHGRKEVVATLIKAGVHPNIRTANGTALHEAVIFGKHHVVRVLLENGADIDAKDSQGKTVYDLLADYSEEATRRVRRALRDFENRRNQRNTYESDDDLCPPFPVPGPDHSPTGYHHSNIMSNEINESGAMLNAQNDALVTNNDEPDVMCARMETLMPPPSISTSSNGHDDEIYANELALSLNLYMNVDFSYKQSTTPEPMKKVFLDELQEALKKPRTLPKPKRNLEKISSGPAEAQGLNKVPSDKKVSISEENADIKKIHSKNKLSISGEKHGILRKTYSDTGKKYVIENLDEKQGTLRKTSLDTSKKYIVDNLEKRHNTLRKKSSDAGKNHIVESLDENQGTLRKKNSSCIGKTHLSNTLFIGCRGNLADDEKVKLYQSDDVDSSQKLPENPYINDSKDKHMNDKEDECMYMNGKEDLNMPIDVEHQYIPMHTKNYQHMSMDAKDDQYIIMHDKDNQYMPMCGKDGEPFRRRLVSDVSPKIHRPDYFPKLGNMSDIYVSMDLNSERRSIQYSTRPTIKSVHFRGDEGCMFEDKDYWYIYHLNPSAAQNNSIYPFIKEKEKAEPVTCFCHEKYSQSKVEDVDVNASQFFSCEDINLYVDVNNDNRVMLQNKTIQDFVYQDLNDMAQEEDSPRKTPMKAPETQKNTNINKSLMSPSSSSLTKNHPQSFVKKLASKCLGLKAKFNSAPNISNSSGPELVVDVRSKGAEHKSTNTMLIGNSKFFKMLTKKEESGEINCNDEFDTISLDRISTLNRDSVVNKSNRSCPGFKTSLPNISENNEISNSLESIDEVADEFVLVQSNSQNKSTVPKTREAINRDTNFIFEPRDKRSSISSNNSSESANHTNECYESFEFTSSVNKNSTSNSIPRPPPRPNAEVCKSKSDNLIYQNVSIDPNKRRPVPAVRTHLPPKIPEESEKKILYENVSLLQERKIPEPPKRNMISLPIKSSGNEAACLLSGSRSSTSSSDSDSFIDESNLEDILLSEKSKSFRHSKNVEMYACRNEAVIRTQSNASDMTDITEVSAIENVDCSEDVDKALYLPMTGTLPSKKKEDSEKKPILFRHKTFTNMEIDRSSYKASEFPKWNNDFLKETLASYHIRGTGHCIYKAPTVYEFLNIFNRDTLHKPSKSNDDNNDAFETAICFCKPKPNKYHNSAEDLLDVCPLDDGDQVKIDFYALNNLKEMKRTSFRCFCDSKKCTFHSDKRDTGNLIVKFSAIKKSISTPDITLDTSFPTLRTSGLIKNKSVPSNLEEPYAVVNLADIILRNKASEKNDESPIYTQMFPHTTLSSTSSSNLYSIKDIADVISLSDHSTLTTAAPSASDTTSVRKSASEHSGHWSLQTCDSNITIKSDATFVTCYDSSDESDGTLHSDEDVSDAETIKSDVSTTKRPWVHSNSFNFGNKGEGAKFNQNVITEETSSSLNDSSSSKIESGISVKGSESSFSECEDDGVPRVDNNVSLDASLERDSGVAGVRSGSGRRRWDEAEGTSEGDALSISSAASSCAPLHLAHHHDYSKVSPTPPKKPPRRNLSVSPTHANSPSSGYSYELRPHARSQDDLDDIQGAKHYLKHGRSVDQYVDGKLSYSEYEDHPSPRIAPIPNPRPSLKNRTQPVAITAMYENVVIKEQNPRRKLRRSFGPQSEGYDNRMNDNRVRKYSNQERSSLESLLDDQSMNSPSDCERYYDGHKADIPLSPTHYDQPPTPDHPPPSAKQAENSIHERIRPLSQLIMEVVEEIRIRKKSQGDVTNS